MINWKIVYLGCAFIRRYLRPFPFLTVCIACVALSASLSFLNVYSTRISYLLTAIFSHYSDMRSLIWAEIIPPRFSSRWCVCDDMGHGTRITRPYGKKAVKVRLWCRQNRGQSPVLNYAKVLTPFGDLGFSDRSGLVGHTRPVARRTRPSHAKHSTLIVRDRFIQLRGLKKNTKKGGKMKEEEQEWSQTQTSLSKHGLTLAG